MPARSEEIARPFGRLYAELRHRMDRLAAIQDAHSGSEADERLLRQRFRKLNGAVLDYASYLAGLMDGGRHRGMFKDALRAAEEERFQEQLDALLADWCAERRAAA